MITNSGLHAYFKEFIFISHVYYDKINANLSFMNNKSKFGNAFTLKALLIILK